MNVLYSFFKTAGAFTLLTTLVAAPWYYGSVTAEALRMIVCAFALCVLFALLTLAAAPNWLRDRIAARTLAALGLFWLATIFFAFVQIHPFAPETARRLSPHIGELADALLPLPDSEEAELEARFFTPEDRALVERQWPTTISVQTLLTRRAIPLLAVAAAAFLLSGIFFPSERDRRVFWFFLTANGAVMAFCIFLYRTNADLGLMEKIWPAAGCPPFVNRNNAGGYLVLCLGPALGFLSSEITASLARLRGAERLTYAGQEMSYRKPWPVRALDSFFELTEAFSKPILYRFLVVGVLMTGACATLSRGATLAALFAFFTAMALIFLVRGAGKGGLALTPILVFVFVLLCFGGLRETVRERMETLSDVEAQKEHFENDSRVVHWKAALETINAYRWRGSGYGTYALANRTNDGALAYNAFFEHAENQAVETALTAGITGLLLKGGFFLILGVMVWQRLCREPSDAEALLFGLGMAAVLAGQAVAASFDFGLTLPANAILLAALCGSYVSLPPTLEPRSGQAALLLKSGRRWGYPLLVVELIALLAALVWSEQTLRRELTDDRTIQLCTLGQSFDELDLTAIDSAIETLDAALAESGENPRLRKLRASASVLRCRWLFFEQFLERDPDANKTLLWLQTAPETLHRRMMLYLRSGLAVGPKKMRDDPVIRENLVPAMREALLARRLSPLDPDIHTLCGLLLPLTAETPDAAALVQKSAERAISVSSQDPRIRFEAGALLFLSGDEESACRLWRENLEKSNRYKKETLALLTSTKNSKKLAEWLDAALPDDFAFLEPLLRSFPKKTSPEAFAAILQKMESSLARRSDDDSGQMHRDRARLFELTDRRTDALAEYKIALEAEPSRAEWHYEYGKLLAAAGELDAGIDALEKALLYSPGNRAYESELESARKRKTDAAINPPELRGLFKKSTKDGDNGHNDGHGDRRGGPFERDFPMDSGPSF